MVIGAIGTAVAVLIGLSVGTGLSWVFLALASWVRNVELMQMLGFMLIFPLMFASSAFVPVSGLPSWLQVIATINPLTYAINAARSCSAKSREQSMASRAPCVVRVLSPANRKVWSALARKYIGTGASRISAPLPAVLGSGSPAVLGSARSTAEAERRPAAPDGR
jgi:hypothetical protein